VKANKGATFAPAMAQKFFNKLASNDNRKENLFSKKD
jgi:hypothetical protein